jgi:hypothetical protein
MCPTPIQPHNANHHTMPFFQFQENGKGDITDFGKLDNR